MIVQFLWTLIFIVSIFFNFINLIYLLSKVNIQNLKTFLISKRMTYKIMIYKNGRMWKEVENAAEVYQHYEAIKDCEFVIKIEKKLKCFLHNAIGDIGSIMLIAMNSTEKSSTDESVIKKYFVDNDYGFEVIMFTMSGERDKEKAV